MKRQRPVCAFPPRRLAPSLEQWPGQWDGPDRQWEGPAPLCHNGRNGPQGRRPITATAATSGPEAAHSIRDHVRQGKRRNCKGITACHHQPGCPCAPPFPPMQRNQNFTTSSGSSLTTMHFLPLSPLSKTRREIKFMS